MDIAIIKETERASLHRKDYQVRIAHEGATPTRAKLRTDLAGNLKAKKECLIVRAVEPDFGNSSAIVSVSVYKDAASLEKFEQAHIRKRHGADAEPEAPKEGDA